MLLQHFYDDKLAQASYLVGCQKTGEAIVIDPSRSIAPYLEAAEKQGLTITKALETHIHADFVSGVRELNDRAGATVVVSGYGAYTFPKEVDVLRVKDGDELWVGHNRLDVLHTPGHTPEHVSYLLTDGANPEAPIGLFSGDFLFVGDVGRPDLLEKAADQPDTARQGAQDMFASLQKLEELDGFVQVWPGHGAGSACGKSLGSVPSSTIGYEKKFNPALQFSSRDAFIAFLLEGQPEPPVYFAEMKRINPGLVLPLSEERRKGILHARPGLAAALAADQEAVVIDTRPSPSAAAGFLPGSINLPYTPGFLQWFGWLVDYTKPHYFIAAPELADALYDECARIGIMPAGIFPPAAVKGSLHHIPQWTPEDLHADELVQAVDVRLDDEWEEGHVPGALHVKLHDIPERAGEVLDKEQPVHVYCLTGVRSAAAASLLKNQGFRVIDTIGGLKGWRSRRLPEEASH
ncbi:MBL fold metallo-hydrolase [Alkalicoccus chagannorensis]|uniref:MBL fold metallo-hydrolase n=1 Tax=Alkalicoccus chagannorensis TaxID=427072 RepID=UPI00047B9C18|nr:MBL fold metallo-hydrolase [Alkalicoccus chagannorensis]